MKVHSDNGCENCLLFLTTFFPVLKDSKLKKSVDKELSQALIDLLDAMKLSCVQVEDNLSIGKNSFVKDVKRAIDEINGPVDIVNLWHVPEQVAINVYAVIKEVVFASREDSSEGETEESTTSEEETEESDHSEDS